MTEYLDHPFGVDRRGRTAVTDSSDHLRDMIHAVLFTRPGERVNRPDFGCGLPELLFQPNSRVLAGELKSRVGSALHRWLADALVVERIDVDTRDGRLVVTVEYIRLDTGRRATDTFEAAREGP